MHALNVVVDGRALVGRRTGIGVHTAEIARRLAVEPPPLIASHAPVDDREGLERCRFRVDPFPLGVAWQQLRLASIGGDVLWAPHTTLPMRLRIPAVASLHDFTSITMPMRHKLRTIASFNLFIGRSLEMASRIAAVSRAVADEAIRGFGVPHSRIEVVPNGVDEFFSPGAGNESDFILYVGTLEPRKGLEVLVSAWWSLPRRPRLVLCGGAGWQTRIAGLPGVEITGYVGRDRLRELYRTARLFVYPSLAEGFGMPPLEAMACGAPVIATRTGAAPEYGAGVAELVPPGDRHALRQAMLRLLDDDGLRQEMRIAGVERAKRYRWDASAARMTELLAEATR